MFQEKSKHFDRDLDEILNRVYGSTSSFGSEIDAKSAALRQLMERREKGSVELKEALSGLRDMREKSQTSRRMKEEMDYLQDQINALRNLGQEIADLRRKLDLEEQ